MGSMREIDEFLRYSMLFGVYKSLFTEKQKKYLEAVFEDDNSFSEVASAMNVTRQAVFENVKSACKKLDDYEKKLNLLEILIQLKKLKEKYRPELLDKIINDMEGN